MAAVVCNGGIIIDLDDLNHPKHEATQLNSEVSFLKKLPLELRLAIYELVVKENQKIRPRRVRDDSNKFVSGSNATRATFSLSRTCRAIYAELESLGPFYKLNRFEFGSASDLHVYLAAITPRRRQAIRYIDLVCYGTEHSFWDLYQFGFGGRRRGNDNHVMELLTQCNVLQNKELTLLVSYDLPWHGSRHYYSDNRIIRDLEMYRFFAGKDSSGLEPSVWSLPCFRLNIQLRGWLFELGRLNYAQLSQSGFSEEIVSVIAAATERKKETGTETPGWFKDMANPSLVSKAIWASGVKVPGEDRVAPDRMKSIMGPVSSRTRKGCKSLDSLGRIIPEPHPRYDKEGVLLGSDFGYIDVKEIRWTESESEIECHVRNYGQGQDIGWVPLSALSQKQFRHNLKPLMIQIMRQAQSPQQVVDSMSAVPSPFDIIKIAKQDGRFRFKYTKTELQEQGRRAVKRTAKYNWLHLIEWYALATKWSERLIIAKEKVASIRQAKRAQRAADRAARMQARAARRQAKAALRQARAARRQAKLTRRQALMALASA
ncbi:hypothetical protein F4818DRAFT_445026 [Hypoxylon cercidicola]|nr:hypothetical protein F4818DRAFT_445026 [Hypoxylon cercidicola]